MRAWPGSAYPLGATWDGSGTNFAIFSEVAELVELCLLNGQGNDGGSETRLGLTEVDGHVWHCYLPDTGPGQRYGFRVHGPHDPASGRLCDPEKLLLDPYAKAIDDAVSMVIDPRFDWAGDRQPRTPLPETLIYEAHVRGLTKRHPGVPAQLRGSYAGLASPVIIEHLQRLGVTAVELLPVHQSVPEPALAERGLTNYWGYNTIGFFAPHQGYASAGHGQVAEFKSMVKALHQAGIEVILDVVYNHTAEAGPSGPTLCFRGIDNAAYYRLADDDPSRYLDYTGCGNSVNASHPRVLQLIMDSLRYWITEMHVDGFRFDLAPALARERGEFDPRSAFFDLVQQDPLVSQAKLIAEPWDVGDNGYQVGNFPAPWSEWNGKYRDCVRDFWRGSPGQLPELATRLAGSSDLYQASGRRPGAAVNFVTCHDGFTLADLVSYDHQHNEANGPGQDGTEDNRSWNCGAEGSSDDESIQALRARQVRNLLATLFLSQGVPMLLAGDEFGRTQGGNNNAFCQDNEISWLDWTAAAGQADLTDFVAALAALRQAHPVLRRARFLSGQQAGDGRADIIWLSPSGAELTGADWDDQAARSVAAWLNGAAIAEPGHHGEPVADADLALLINGSGDEVTFHLPAGLGRAGAGWELIVDTARPAGGATGPGQAALDVLAGQDRTVPVAARSVIVLRSAGMAGG